MNEEVKNAKEPKYGIFLIKKYQDLWKEQAKKLYIYSGETGKIAKKIQGQRLIFWPYWSKSIQYAF